MKKILIVSVLVALSLFQFGCFGSSDKDEKGETKFTGNLKRSYSEKVFEGEAMLKQKLNVKTSSDGCLMNYDMTLSFADGRYTGVKVEGVGNASLNYNDNLLCYSSVEKMTEVVEYEGKNIKSLNNNAKITWSFPKKDNIKEQENQINENNIKIEYKYKNGVIDSANEYQSSTYLGIDSMVHATSISGVYIYENNNGKITKLTVTRKMPVFNTLTKETSYYDEVKTRSFEYNEKGLLTKITTEGPYQKAVETNSYNADNKLVETVTNTGNKTFYVYNGARLKQIKEFKDGKENIIFDNIETLNIDPLEITTIHSYYILF